MNESALPIATWSGAILLPKAARRASSAAVGIGVLPLASGDHEQRGSAVRAAERDGTFRACLDAARGIHRQQRSVGRLEALDDLAGEVGIAGRVDQLIS